MPLPWYLYLALLWFPASISIGRAVVIWRRRANAGALCLAGLLADVAQWPLTTGFEALATGQGTKSEATL